MSVGTFQGTRSGTLIAPSLAAAHGIVLALLLMTRLPYDQLGILTGFGAHLVWAIGLHVSVHRKYAGDLPWSLAARSTASNRLRAWTGSG